MVFLTTADLHTHIRAERLTELIDNDTTILDAAEAAAVAIVKNALGTRFDVTTIFQTTGTARPAEVVLWVKHITIYEIMGRLPDKQVGERIIKNYDDTLAMLTDIEDGKKETLLPKKITDGQPVTKFRYGSKPLRSFEF